MYWMVWDSGLCFSFLHTCCFAFSFITGPGSPGNCISQTLLPPVFCISEMHSCEIWRAEIRPNPILQQLIVDTGFEQMLDFCSKLGAPMPGGHHSSWRLWRNWEASQPGLRGKKKIRKLTNVVRLRKRRS